jgi:hypothetical protein
MLEADTNLYQVVQDLMTKNRNQELFVRNQEGAAILELFPPESLSTLGLVDISTLAPFLQSNPDIYRSVLHRSLHLADLDAKQLKSLPITVLTEYRLTSAQIEDLEELQGLALDLRVRRVIDEISRLGVPLDEIDGDKLGKVTTFSLFNVISDAKQILFPFYENLPGYDSESLVKAQTAVRQIALRNGLFTIDPGRIQISSQLLEAFNKPFIKPLLRLLHPKYTGDESPLSRKQLDYLEMTFMDYYSKRKGGIEKYILPDTLNPEGSVIKARQLELECLAEYGISEAEYLDLLQRITEVAHLQEDDRTSKPMRIAINGMQFYIARGTSQRSGYQFNPFEDSGLDPQDRSDVSIIRSDENFEDNFAVMSKYTVKAVHEGLMVWLPSSWESTAAEYGFYEYNVEFAFGPRVLLKFLFGDAARFEIDRFQELVKELQSITDTKATY